MTKEDIELAVRAGFASLDVGGDQDLALRDRKRLWRAFGPVETERDFAARAPAHRGRTLLALSAVEHTLPLWEKLWDDREPHEMLRLVGQYMAFEIESQDVFEFANRLTTRGQNTHGLKSHQLRGVYVAQAAAAVGFTALQDEWCDDSGESDEEIDSWDAAYLSSWAWVGCARWEPGGSTEAANARRGDYWRWYLGEAVPAAWEEARTVARRG
ncbi:MAG: Imm5 family immunity protein [Sandaracinaceae bacterium]